MRDERERAAPREGLQYVGLDGTVGIIANGAGLAMSTLDVVNQVGGEPANFLDIGGGANATCWPDALEVINNDPNVKSIFINIFGGITRGEEVANGIVEALGRVELDAPIVIRLDGTNADEGRAILSPHLSDRLTCSPPCSTPRARAVELAAADRERHQPVSIFVDENTKVVYQGLTGSQGRLLRLLQPRLRHPGRGGHQPQEGRHRRGRHPDLRHGRRRASRPPAPTRRASSSRRRA
ncbi:MAG: hypothetical protein KatS3mg010_1318 [Acidimicrobiia bacterium]|nr:MAG: hypothetical protein KatS3mg010_1318 [Acidimicrobiia bacterium]